MAKWTFEPGHSSAEFCVKHMMVTWLRGFFNNVQGSLEFDPENPGMTSVEMTITVKNLWSGDKMRDDHLLSEDFLDEKSHPTITFKSTKFDVVSKHESKVTGNLTIRGVTKQVALDMKYVGKWNTPFWEDGVDKGPISRVGFHGITRINRHEFGVSCNGDLEKGGIVVGNEVFIIIDIEALEQQ